MARKNKSPKIRQYRKPINLNVGMIVFALIFVYMVFSVYTYLSKDRVQFYEVEDGSIVNDKSYTGIILRDETTVYSEYAGYITYYIREGKRAAVGTKIYSVDETGNMASYLADHPEVGYSLSEESLYDLKKQLSLFSATCSDDYFQAVYDAKYSLEAATAEYINFSSTDSLDSLLAESGISFRQITADQAGVISYAIDSYEDLEVSGISQKLFDRTDYKREISKAGQQIGKDTPVYKVITSDLWSILFRLSEEDEQAYRDEQSLQIKFSGHDITISGDFSIVTGEDGELYGKLDFNKYMVQFVSDRFVSFDIISTKTDGLKIPATSVTTKVFYLVPLSYMAQGGNSSAIGFNKEIYQDGKTTATFVTTTIYYSTDTECYIDASDKSPFKAGDYIIKPDSTERYQISATDTLEGVYNINKGYAVFKQIEILNSNNEYLTIKKSMKYGLSVYDHIVLDANTVYESELIYQ